VTATTWRHVAEHEAAHAVVAAHFGLVVTRVVARAPGDGYTEYEQSADPAQRAAVTAAGDVYGKRLGSVPYVDLACDDLAKFERVHGLPRLWQAQRIAFDILTRRRAAVVALADRIERERAITFVG
jgi:hypothetical protein